MGVPGERFSNMGPPTLAIVALTFLQVGLVLVIRPKVLAWLDRGSLAQKVVGWINEHAMPLYLFHSTGMAVVVGHPVRLRLHTDPPSPPSNGGSPDPSGSSAPPSQPWPLLALYRVSRRPTAAPVPKLAD